MTITFAQHFARSTGLPVRKVVASILLGEAIKELATSLTRMRESTTKDDWGVVGALVDSAFRTHAILASVLMPDGQDREVSLIASVARNMVDLGVACLASGDWDASKTQLTEMATLYQTKISALR